MKPYRMLFSALVWALILLGSSTVYAGKFFKMNTFNPGSTSHTVSTTFSNIVHKYTEGEYTLQVSTGKTATRSAIDVARGKAQFFIMTPAINEWLRTGQEMFKKIKNSEKLHSNLRGIFFYPTGAFQFVVYEDSGIKTFHDLKGKKVYVGPKTGAASVMALSVIEGVSGLKADVDYDAVKLDWNSARPAFQDRQFSMYMEPTSIPGTSISQLALTNRIRLLDIPEAALTHPKIAEQLKTTGRTLKVIPPKVYGKNQTNEVPITAIGGWIGVGTHAGVDDDSIYQLTKVFWENIEDLYSVAVWTKQINKDTAFNQMNVPLHKGAYRYYKEAGFKIPDHVTPKD